ncbi:hypothetical protein LguiB_003940 [Lonicera macranthoides]
MSGKSKLGVALTIIFLISLLALFAELFYVLYRRQVFPRQLPAVHGGDLPEEFSGESYSSKELLHFFCLKTQARVEPAGDLAPATGGGSGSDESMEVIDVFKLGEMYGPSRVLFTIREEERKELEPAKSAGEKLKTMGPPELAGESPEVVMTPFSTPGKSPVYFTPVGSPFREMDGCGSTDQRV